MWVLLIIVAAATGAIAYNLGRRQQPVVRATAEADAVVAFLIVVNQKCDPRTAQAVRGVAWETYSGQTRDYMMARWEASQVPPVE